MVDDDLLEFLDDFNINSNQNLENNIIKENEYINKERLSQSIFNLENKILKKLKEITNKILENINTKLYSFNQKQINENQKFANYNKNIKNHKLISQNIISDNIYQN